MAQVFRVERNKNFTVMSNHHFKNKDLSLKAKGLLSLMLSLPEDWNYNMQGLASMSRDGIDSVRSALKELEHYGYVSEIRLEMNMGFLWIRSILSGRFQLGRKMSSPYWDISPTEKQCWKIQYWFFQGNK